MADFKMPDINMVVIAGNLTGDPSFRRTTNGTPVANFYIASNRRYKDNLGQWRENVCYVGVVAWYKLAESCFENLKKGSAVLIEGELQSREWKNEDGSSKNVVELKARRIQFLSRKRLDDAASDCDSASATDHFDESGSDSELASKKNDNSNPEKLDFGFGNLNI